MNRRVSSPLPLGYSSRYRMNAKSDKLFDIGFLLKMQEINDRLRSINRVDDLCWSLTDWVVEICDLEDCVLYLRTGNMLTQTAAVGVKRSQSQPNQIIDRIGLPIGSGIAGAAAKAETTIYVPDTSQDSRYIRDVFQGASELSIPIKYRGEVLGVLDVEHAQIDGIKLAQRAALETMAILVSPHLAELQRKPNYQSLNYSEAVAELAHNTIGRNDNLKNVFANVTEKACRTLRVSRANIWLFDIKNPEQLICQDEYASATDQHTNGQSLDTKLVPAYVQALKEERVILAVEAANDPRTAELKESYLAPQDVKSMLDAPIRLDGQVIGVLCLEQMHSERDWTEDEANFAGALADLSTIALANHRKTIAESALVHAQKMESLGRLAGGIAHDFNNLLTVISGAVETIQADASKDARNSHLLGLIHDAADRASRLTKNLMAFGGQQQLELQPFPIRNILHSVQNLTNGIIREDISVTFEVDDHAHVVSGDAVLLEQVLLNLILNGIDAMPNGGALTVKLLPDLRDGCVGISVSDTGSGMTDTIRERIFDPFFTTKIDIGTGLGLSVSLGVVSQHGGTLKCTETTPEGSRFEMWLPVIEADALNQQEPEAYATNSQHNWPQSILFVEDEENVRAVVTDMLHTLGFAPIVADSPEHALAILAGQPIELLLSDVVMPGMRGPELYQAALSLQPELHALFISGYTEEILINMNKGSERINYLAKPFSLGELKQAIDQSRSNHRAAAQTHHSH